VHARNQYDVAVIGAGQAGLTMGYELAQQGRRFVILEAADSVGPAWRTRWDSLTLFTPRRYDSLPGLEFPGDPDGYPGRDEVITYLESYAETHDLPVQLGSEVRSVTSENGGFRLDLQDGAAVEADQVVVATGPFQVPRVPALSADLDTAVFQTHSVGYRNPGELPDGPVLVVGGGNTGFQIAEELAAERETHLSVGSRQMPLPQRIGGRDLFWWLGKLGILEKSVDTKLGRRLSTRDTLIGSSPRTAKRAGVTMHGRAVGASGRTAVFEDGSTLDVAAAIWATGYRFDHSWIDLPITDDDGKLVHRRGVTDVPGLYFLGLPWQHTRGSALVGWVKDDAEFIAERIAQRAPASSPTALEGAATRGK
jgi:putative flavoprotein involved in K+ transport